MSSFKNKVEFNYSKVSYDQSTYWGRVRHFMEVTNPINFFVSPQYIED